MRVRDRNRTQFCFIGPGSTLDKYASASRTHLVLPHVTNPKYQEFYIRKRNEGDLIILDNGAYEGVEDWSLVEAMIDFYRPQVAALPDFLLQDGEKTFETARLKAKEWRGRWPWMKLMYIPQAEAGDPNGFYSWMNKGIRDFRPEWIGLPRAMVTDIAPGNPNYRIDACEELTLRGLKVHALGMHDGSLAELEGLFWEGCCSIDSSCAIWRGLYHSALDSPGDRRTWNKVGTSVNFDLEGTITMVQDRYIKRNMNSIFEMLGKAPIL